MNKTIPHSVIGWMLTNLSVVIASALFILTGHLLSAQNVSINTDGSPPDSSAILDVSADNKGVLIPRVSLSGTDDTITIKSPQTSLFVYNTATTDDLIPGYYYWDGNAWSRLSTMWKQDSADIYYNEGNVGIGIQAPDHLLEVIGNSGVEYKPVAYFENTLDSLDGDRVHGFGVMGVSDTIDGYGYGVYGLGGFIGVRGRVLAQDTFGYIGVAGTTTGGGGYNFGVTGYATGEGENTGVRGNAGGPGDNYGVRGNASGGQSNYAIFGTAHDTSETSQTYAGFFEGDVHISDRLGIGVYRPIQHKLQVVGESRGSHEPIAYFENTMDSLDGQLVDAYGVMGVCDQSDWAGFGGLFRGGFIGVQGEVFPTDTFSYLGVYGKAIGGSGVNYGTYGYAKGDGISIGVRGLAKGTDVNYGLTGYAADGATNIAVRGVVNTTGVQGTYAGYFVGDTYISGDLGIGTESPDNTFELSTDDRVATIYLTTYRNDGGFTAGQFMGRSARGSQESPSNTLEGDRLASFGGKGYGNTGFGSPPPNARMSIEAAQDWSDTTKGTDIAFFTTPIDQTSTSERLRISESGYVGIGSTDPQQLLHLFSDNAGGMLRIQSSNADSSDRGIIEWYTNQNPDTWAAKIGPSSHLDDQGLVIATNSPGDFNNQKDIVFKASGNEHMRIKGNGRVGIGTNSPGVRLEVDGDTWLNSETVVDDNLIIGRTSSDNFIQFKGSSGNSIFKMFPADFWLQTDVGVKTRIASGDEFRIQTYDGSYQDRIFVKGTGEVGVGTTSPTELLEVKGGSPGEFFGLSINQNANGGGYPSLFFRDENDNNLASIFPHQNRVHLYFRLTTGDFVFDRSPSQDVHMIIKENGNVGVGTVTPGYKLDITGDLNYTDTLRRNGTPVSFSGDFSNGGEAGGEARTLGNSDNYNLGFITNGISRLQVMSDGNIRMDGNIGINTTPLDITSINKSISLNASALYSSASLVLSGHNLSTISLTSRRVGATSGRTYTLRSGGGSVSDLDRFGIYSSLDGYCLSIRNGGNVGIGVDNPTTKLDIDGDLNYSGTLRQNGTPVSLTGDFSDGGESASTHRSLGNTDNYHLGLMTNSVERLFIKNNGMVGIGTTTPSAMLEVIDTINTGGLKMATGASSGHVLTSDASGNASWQAPSGAGSVPIGAILPWAKSISGVPALPAGFVECGGQTLVDAGSPLNGQTIPDLNIAHRFLRGSDASGAIGGSDSHAHLGTTGPSTSTTNVDQSMATQPVASDPHSHSLSINATPTLPSYYEVVWIMRVK